jgi:N-acetylglucosaminyldiphosphoundecaprenol N-acetyl-beta-D-mannosaminyltransferase
MNSHSQIKCFGLEIQGLTSDGVIREIENRQPNNPYWIVTANPEILLQAKRDSVYAQTLRNADVRIVDSIGLKLLGLIQGKKLVRTAGVDMAEALVVWAHKTEQTVGFIGGQAPNIAAKAYAKMAEKYPGLKGLTENGGTVSKTGEGDDANDEARHRLTLLAPDILLVAFGHPKQELWIERYIQEFPTLKAVVGIGGTFDYWGGAVKRAPKWIRSIGMEWLYRLIKEPKRWKRIFDAVVVFPVLAMKDLAFGQKT